MKEKNLPAIEIIKQIKDGSINPQELSQGARKNVVERLLMELKSVSEIAAFLKTSDRTIQRDKYELAQKNSGKSSFTVTLDSLAELMQKNEAAIRSLKALPAGERSKAASYLLKSLQEQMEILQNLGILPK